MVVWYNRTLNRDHRAARSRPTTAHRHFLDSLMLSSLIVWASWLDLLGSAPPRWKSTKWGDANWKVKMMQTRAGLARRPTELKGLPRAPPLPAVVVVAAAATPLRMSPQVGSQVKSSNHKSPCFTFIFPMLLYFLGTWLWELASWVFSDNTEGP